MSQPSSSAEDQIAIIEQSLRQASRQKTGASNYYLIWGCTLTLYFLLQFSHACFRSDITRILANASSLLFAVGGIASYLQSRKDDQTERLVPIHEKLYTFAWIGASIALGVLCITYLNNFIQVLCIGVALIFGLVNFIIGGVTRFVPLIVGGSLSMLSCIPMAHASIAYQFLLAAFAIFATCLVPGILMKSTNAHV